MTPAQKLISALFAPADVINVRVLLDVRTGDPAKDAKNNLIVAANVTPALNYPGAFPCVGINPRKTLRVLATIKNLAIDIDGAPLPTWAKERADVICSRGKDHHHLYFCFAEGVTRDEYKAIAARLIAATPGADKAVSDPERVLRLPGFAYNKKGVSGDGYKIAFLRKKINRLPIAEKFAWLKTPEKNTDISDMLNLHAGGAQQVTDVKPTPQNVAAPNAVAYLKNLYLKKDKIGSGDGRSRRLWFVGIDCHAWGVPVADAIALANEINATFTPPETSQVVGHQVKSAYKYAKGEFGALATRSADATEAKRRAEYRAFERANKVRDEFSEWVYIHAAARFCDSTTGFHLASKEQVEDYITAKIGEPVSLRDMLARDALATCDRMAYAPDKDARIFERGDLKFYNAYATPEPAKRDDRLKKTAGRIFRAHCEYLTTSEAEAETLINYFAYCVQNRGKKIDWTPLLIAPEGVGKSSFYKLFSNIFGEHNCSTVDAENLLEGWTDFIAEKLFVVSHEVEMSEKQGLKKLKTLITEKRIRINAKYERKYETDNCANFLLLSNEANALRLTDKARRFFVVFSRAEPREKEYYAKLFDAFENGAGWVEDYLMARDLTNFSAHGAAPRTEGLTMLAAASTPDNIAWLDERRENQQGEFAKPIINAAHVVADALSAPANIEKYITRRSVATYLSARGFRPVVFWETGKTKRGWFKGSDEEFLSEIKKLKEKTK